MTYTGIDYGLGMSNIDHETGIRFGVIPVSDIEQAWCDSVDGDYGPPCCPACGEELPEGFGDTGACKCGHVVDWVGDECYGDSPLSWDLDDGKYRATQGGDDCDVFVLKAPYFTYARFCSPCAPGACYLRNPLDEKAEANKCYCFGHEWFEDGKAPYPVYRVDTGEEVKP